MKVQGVVPAVVLMLFAVHKVDAQGPTQLTRADSAQLRVMTARVLRDSLLSPADHQGRIWISTRMLRRGASGAGEFVLSDAQWNEIARAFPESRLIKSGDTAFLCPPGIVVRMPGSGCPIREDGIIIEIGALYAAGDSVTTFGFLIRSRQTTVRTSTWAEGLILVFERSERVWRLRGIRGHTTT